MPRWDDPASGEGSAGDLYRAAVRIARDLASSPVLARGASLLLLKSDVLRCVAAIGMETAVGSVYRLADHPSFERSITAGEITEHSLGWVIAVPVNDTIAGLLVVGEPADLDPEITEQLVTLARLIGVGVGQEAAMRELGQEAERSRRLERLKSEFLNIAAHELRSPLGIIRGYASMLSEGMLSEPDRTIALERIAEKSEEMAELVSDMLETARLETLGLEISPEPVDLGEVIDEATSATRPLLGPNHRFVLGNEGQSIAVLADRRRLAVMLTNLIDNAIKYSPAGGDIEISYERDSRLATIVIRDQGIGINTEQAHMLFTRFGRLVTPETSHIRGTGLGLYLARETARLHGGDIIVTSVPGKGSTFRITLPTTSS